MSFKITMGMLLTGSIIKPRIVISTSIVTSTTRVSVPTGTVVHPGS